MAQAMDPDAESKKGAGLDRIHAIWRRRKWLAVVVFVLPFTAAASVVVSLPDLYRSTATVLVERQQVPESFVKSTVTSELETRLQTISQEILSRSRLESLITRFGLYADLGKQESNKEAVIDRMRRDIRLEVRSAAAKGDRRATIAFALNYRGRDPQTVALVTNTLASFYIEENLKAREKQASGTTEFLKAQIGKTKERLDQQERRVSEFKRRYLGELPQQMQPNLATLEVLNTQLRLNSDNQVRATERRDALTAQLSEAETFGQTLGAPLAPGGPAGGPATGPEPPALHLARLKQELTTARARYTDSHPTVLRLMNEITAVESALAGTRPEAKPEAGPAPAPAPAPPASPYMLRLREALHGAEGEIKILKTEEQRLRSAITAYQIRVENSPRREQEFQDISRDYDSTKEQHHSLVKRYEEAQVAENMEQRQKGEQFRILDPAVPSAVTAAPNRGRLLLIALALSVGLAACAAMLAEMLDTSFHSAGEMRAFSTVPVLVSIPRIITDADRHRRRRRFQVAVAGTLVGLALLAGGSHVFARGNEQIVRLLDKGAA
jgi:polysaccharide chain length determinant protein (PEP-CTERM system associated)